MDGGASAGSGMDSDRTDSTSFTSCETASGLGLVADELDDNVPEANLHAPSKTVFHENGTVDEESVADGVETSVSGSTAGLVDGSTEKVDSLGSARSGTGTGLDNSSDTKSG